MKEMQTPINYVKKIKKEKFTYSFFVTYAVPALILIIVLQFALLVGMIDTTYSASHIALLNLLVLRMNRKRRNYGDEENEFLKSMNDLFNLYSEEKIKVKHFDQLEIIPTNLKIGEDLDGRVAREIFKEGHYVVFQNKKHTLAFRQYENDEAFVLDFMEPTDEKIIQRDLPNHPELVLKLTKKKPGVSNEKY